jgi:hypothetical protein
MKKTVVYWIKYSEYNDPKSQGYIGSLPNSILESGHMKMVTQVSISIIEF